MRIMPDQIKKITAQIIKGMGATREEANLVAESLVRAELRGVETHGLTYLKPLAERIEAGLVQIPTRLKIVKENKGIALLDGGNGLGQVAAHRAMKICIQKAKEFGVSCVLIRNTNHIGILASYTLMAADEGMMGMIMCNAAPSMAPWGGAEAFLGTNPISIAVPGGSKKLAIVLDMASSMVARGKIRLAQRKKESIPLGWAVDETGVPTTDPIAAIKGTLLPIGGPKGYGLALMIDILSGILSGSKFGQEVKTFHQLEGPTGIGVCCLAIDIKKFMNLQQFYRLMSYYIASIKRVRKAKGVSRIYLPGEIEFEKEKKSLKGGIKIDRGVAKDLNELLKRVKSPLRLN